MSYYQKARSVSCNIYHKCFAGLLEADLAIAKGYDFAQITQFDRKIEFELGL